MVREESAGASAGSPSKRSNEANVHQPGQPRSKSYVSAAPAVDINLATIAPMGDVLLPKLDAIRAVDPIFWSDLSRCWIVTGHDAVTEGFSGKVPLLNGKMESLLQRVLPEDELRRRIPN